MNNSELRIPNSKLKMRTPSLADEHFAALAALFPNAVTETIDENGTVVRAIDKDVLMQEISAHVVEGREERYQFTWPDKRKSILLANAPIAAALRPCRAESVDFDTTENLYIEGDNLDVLKLLRETYLGRVKMIYIDPPYNTGSDLVYDDDFSQDAEAYIASSGQYDQQGNKLVQNTESNGRYHTDWLNMLFPRLRLAKDLLSSDGVIFISIDDNEAVNLKKLCDEVFGSINYVGQITVVGNPRGRDYGGVARMHDYLFVYKKSPEAIINLIDDPDNVFPMSDELGGFELRELRNRNIKFNKENRPNLYYPFYINPNDADKDGLLTISLEPHEGWVELFPLESQGVNTVWRWGKPKAMQNLNVNIKGKPMRNGSYMIVEKYRESRMMARSVWWDKDTNTEKGTLLVKELLDGKVFDYPKPVEMLKRICEMGTSPDTDDLVLDFFSGSATTAHAVMLQNASDGGKRKFIMVQLPEITDEHSYAREAGYGNICEIGKERIRRAGAKINSELGIRKAELKSDNSELQSNSEFRTPNSALDIGFRVLKLDSSNMKDVYYTPDALLTAVQRQRSIFGFMDNIKEDRSPEDLLFQVLLDLGIPLSSPIRKAEFGTRNCTVFDVADGYLLACFEQVDTDLITAIARLKPYYAVFRDSSFISDSAMVNFEQVFNTYSPSTIRRVL